MLNKLAVVALITVASPALAQAMDNRNVYLVAGGAGHRLVATFHQPILGDPQGYFSSGRDQMVNELGN
jgi:hypothetical protein